MERRMSTHVELRTGAYHDSVSLMQVSRVVAGTPGVLAAQVAMATELNVDVLTSMGFDVPPEAGPNDLVIALRTDTPDAVAAGLAAVADALAALRATSDSGGGDDTVAPRTLGSAAARVDATLAVISVPGPARRHRGLRRHHLRPVGDALLRQRVRRGRGAPQGCRRRR
jgi:FdrA protein